VDRIGDIAHLEAELHDAERRLVARATATAKVIPLAGARDAP
jgi:acyl-coenzyme A thioesterase PaaI-like protein